MVLPLPMIKLGGLIVRTLTKPLAKVVKSRSKVDPALNAVCHRLGQQQHRLLIRFHMGYRGIANYTIKDIPSDQAVEKGADLIGELIIFSVAVGVASFEYQRSATKSREKERAELARKLEQEEAVERRFQELEDAVTRLNTQVAALGQILERDMQSRLISAELEDGSRTELHVPRRGHRRPPAPQQQQEEKQKSNVESTPTSGDGGGLWSGTYSAIANLFR